MALPTLLVICDLVCNWKLDGEIRGHLEAGGGAKVKVESGQHMVEALTEDGIDGVRLFIAVKATGQTLASIELQPIRDKRIWAYNEAMAKLNSDAQEQAARETQEEQNRQREARDRQLALLQQAALRQPWTDPVSGLMWTRKDNGADLSWQGAKGYCRNLQLAGYSDWRLPTPSELEGLRNINEIALKGNLQLSEWAWSGVEFLGKKGKSTGYAWAFDPNPYETTGSKTAPVDGRGYPGKRALCVRSPSYP